MLVYLANVRFWPSLSVQFKNPNKTACWFKILVVVVVELLYDVLSKESLKRSDL